MIIFIKKSYLILISNFNNYFNFDVFLCFKMIFYTYSLHNKLKLYIKSKLHFYTIFKFDKFNFIYQY